MAERLDTEGQDIPTYKYRTFRLDASSPNLPFLAGKYAAVSLCAYITNPESFGVAYSTEGSLDPLDFVQRLSRPSFNIFICVAHPGTLLVEKETIEHGHWIDMVTLIDPTPKDVFWIRQSGASEPLDDSEETKFHQTATWMDPAHRGKGLSKQLINSAIDFATKSLDVKVKQLRMRAITGPTNEQSKRLYGGLGFSIVGGCTISEVMFADGNARYPFRGRTDWEEDVMIRRNGAVMERLIRLDDSVATPNR
ncbi:hypothetical protein EJ08DRAFT_2591 [Tothia fuscella]|uniref:N-acetyltransferase domain-containing protein n=1 Tax=Tothia fuscella TaxID=1048955 RepID=A0A9P4U563_9PEZI|nr:hypothetical protein EJ08DRAFT_2591 [Tothia fuscella]